MLVLNLPFKALMFLTLMRPSLVLFLVLWLKLVKDFLKVRSKEAKMGKVMRHTLGASLNIRHNLSSSKGPKPLQLKLLTTYIPKTSAFTLAFSTSQRLRTTRASARTFFTFRHYITPSARNF